MFNRFRTQVLATAALASLAACADGPTQSTQALMDASFASVPAGFGDVNSSFVPDDGPPTAFMPGMQRGPGLAGPGGPRRGFGEAGGPGGGCMGGGLDNAFAGGVEFGRGPHRGPFGFNGDLSNCVYASGNVTCTTTHNGLSVTAVHTWSNGTGTQERPDSTTNTAHDVVTVTGSVTRRDSSVSVINHHSDRTVTGLAYNATQRTVNSTSAGSENTTGTNRDGVAFTAVRSAGDTIVGLVIPMQDGRPTYPTAGTVTRSMSASITANGNTTNRSRREVITYNGSATATVVITQDGQSKTCQLPLPRGRMVCN